MLFHVYLCLKLESSILPTLGQIDSCVSGLCYTSVKSPNNEQFLQFEVTSICLLIWAKHQVQRNKLQDLQGIKRNDSVFHSYNEVKNKKVLLSLLLLVLVLLLLLLSLLLTAP